MDKIKINGNSSVNELHYPSDIVVKAVFEVSLRGKENKLCIDENTVVTNLKIFYMGNNSSVFIGSNCRVGGVIIVEDDCSVVIGNGTNINHNATRIHCGENNTNIEIGHNCLLANVRFRTSDEHSVIDRETGNRLNNAKSIKVAHNVWLAEEVSVYKGVTIGAGSIVAARSTVTKSLPENCLCAGTPAKVVKSDVTWDARKL